MTLQFRFAIASDLHIAQSHTIYDHPGRFHLVELSIPAFESVLDDLARAELDFLLIPGDLTQHGEPENHRWLARRLAQLPYPAYVIPGNHDVPTADSLSEFATYYRDFGYSSGDRPYYTCELLPGVRLIGLNSNQFDRHGEQIGWVDSAQMQWLENVLRHHGSDVVLVAVHHNTVEHVPNQASSSRGSRYMLGNADRLNGLLGRYGVQLTFTGHLHVQDIAYHPTHDLYDITTGSLVSYPHPYRVLEYVDRGDRAELRIRSHRVRSLPGYGDLQHFSREWMGDRSFPFVRRLLVEPPLSLSLSEAEALAPHLRYFWATIADGDARFHFPDLPHAVRSHFEQFSDRAPGDNDVTLTLRSPGQHLASYPANLGARA